MYLLKYGFDSQWVNSMTESQRKRMLAGYLGQSYRNALQKPQPESEGDDASNDGSGDDSGNETDPSS